MLVILTLGGSMALKNYFFLRNNEIDSNSTATEAREK
jgi:hypothetical protein